jgi:hypothetical protein
VSGAEDGGIVVRENYLYPILAASTTYVYSNERWQIKTGNSVWTGGNISSTTTFDLYVEDVKVDSETVTMVENGVGTKGDTKGTITIYYLQAKPTSGTPTAPSVPTNDSNLSDDDWYATKPRFDASNNTDKDYLWSTQGTFTTTSDGVTTYGGTWETPKLIEARNTLGVPFDVYAEYLRLTNFEQSDGFYYGEKGTSNTAPLYINASHIKTGTFEVKDANNNVAFSAGWTKDDKGTTIPNVSIAGWTVSKDSISTGTFGSDGFHMYSKGFSAANVFDAGTTAQNWALGIGSNFGVTTNGAIYATSGKIGNMTIEGLNT